MQHKQHTVLWQKSLALLSLLALLFFSIANAAHIHSEVRDSHLQQECVLCISGVQSAALLVHTAIFAAYQFAFSFILPRTEQVLSLDQHCSTAPRAPPAIS